MCEKLYKKCFKFVYQLDHEIFSYVQRYRI